MSTSTGWNTMDPPPSFWSLFTSYKKQIFQGWANLVHKAYEAPYSAWSRMQPQSRSVFFRDHSIPWTHLGIRTYLIHQDVKVIFFSCFLNKRRNIRLWMDTAPEANEAITPSSTFFLLLFALGFSGVWTCFCLFWRRSTPHLADWLHCIKE